MLSIKETKTEGFQIILDKKTVCFVQSLSDANLVINYIMMKAIFKDGYKNETKKRK